MALTTEQQIERKQKIDIARAKAIQERTPEERLLVQEADMADATARAQAAEAAANERQWQYEQQTFLQRNPTFQDNTANVEILRSLLAAKGWGWDAKSMEHCFRNNLDAFTVKVAPRPVVNPALEPPAETAPVIQNYGLTAEIIRNLSNYQLTEIRQKEKKKFAVLQQIVTAWSSKLPSLARKYFSGIPLTSQDIAEIRAAGETHEGEK